MFCPNCGTQNDDDGVKCQKCGFNLKGAAAPKFKGTMLMMNSPMAQAPKPAAPPSAVPGVGAAPWPKSMAKATMIGVAPPSPGAVAPPGGGRSPAAPAVGGTMGLPSAPAGPPASIPLPVPPAPQQPAGQVSVNPFGGTMLMGAVPPASPAPIAAESKPYAPVADRTVTSEGAPQINASAPMNLESTTPSVAPPLQASPMPPVHAAMSPLGPVNAALPQSDLVQSPAFPLPSIGNSPSALGVVAPVPYSAGLAPSPVGLPGAPKVRAIGLVVVLGFVTFGIYWIIALLGGLKDFNSIRRKNDVKPILFILPILGLLELLKLPGKVMETRAAVGVSNPVAPNVVLYLLFPQIFFIADLNEIVEAAARRNSLA